MPKNVTGITVIKFQEHTIPCASVSARIIAYLYASSPPSSVPQTHEVAQFRSALLSNLLYCSTERAELLENLLKTQEGSSVKNGGRQFQRIRLCKEIGTTSFSFICIFYLFLAARRKVASGMLADRN